MRLLRPLLIASLAAPLVAAPVVAPVWAAPQPVTPEIQNVPVVLDTAAAPASGGAAGAPDERATTVVPDGTRAVQATPTVPAPAVAPRSAAEVTLVTPAVEADDFVTVGATWSGASVTDVTVEVRVSNGDVWGGWQLLPAGEEGPDPGTPEALQAPESGTDALWVGDADRVQVRLTGSAAALPERVDVALIDPGTSPADGLRARPAASADAATAAPKIVLRKQWGADESLKQCKTSANSTIKAAIVHHTAGSNAYASVADAMRQLRADYAYHTQTRKWCDLGYNFVVDKWGNIYEGRSGGVSKPIIGAHAGGFNTSTVGVSMLGTYSAVAPSPAMRNAVAEVIGWKLSTYERDPQGSVTLTSAGSNRYPPGTVVRLPVVMGHRDVTLTDCPGNQGMAILPGVRDQAAARAQNAPFVRALYADMMDREADEGGLRTWTTALAAGGRDRRSVIRSFAASDEYRLLSIDQAYRAVLDRAPDAAGRRSWLESLRSGRVRIETLRPTLLQTQEFYLLAGGTDEGWVDRLYRSALHRSAAPAERAFWVDVRRRQGALAAIEGIWGSAEAGMIRVKAAYRYYLGRDASGSEQRYWLPVVKGFGDEKLREELTVSAEYFARAARRFR